MKFQCDRCKTRYSIADEKVRGKILKIRCKSCEAIITVRDQAASGPVAPIGPAPSAAPVAPLVTSTGGKRAARAPMHTVNLATMSGSMLAAAIETAPQAPPRHAAEATDPAALPEAEGNPEEWYLSVDGEQNGPFSAEEAQRRVSRKGPNVEMFAWRDDFEEWLPVEEVPVLAVHLPRSTRRQPTIPPLPPRAAEPPRVSATSLPASSRASGSPLPPPPRAEDTADRSDDLFGDAQGAQTTVSAPPEGATDDGLDFNIGEASRLVKLPILPPPSAAPPSGSSGSSLPGMFARNAGSSSGGDKAERADASLKLNIASLSSELPAVGGSQLPKATPAPAPLRASSETVPPVAPRLGRRLGLPVIVVGATAFAILLVVVLLAARTSESDGARAAEKASGPDNILVNNFYSKDNPLFGNEPRKPTDPVVEITEADKAAAAKAKAAPVAVAPRPREGKTGDGREPQVRLDPVSRPAAATIGSGSRDKVDSFSDDEPQSGALTPDDVRNTYAANEVGLKRCYERSLKNDPTSAVTKMVVKITITPNGNVSEITVPDRGSDLGSCVSNSIRAWRFRRSTGEFTTEFTVFFAKRG